MILMFDKIKKVNKRNKTNFGIDLLFWNLSILFALKWSTLIYFTLIVGAQSLFDSLSSLFHGTKQVLKNMDDVFWARKQQTALPGFDFVPIHQPYD